MWQGSRAPCLAFGSESRVEPASFRRKPGSSCRARLPRRLGAWGTTTECAAGRSVACSSVLADRGGRDRVQGELRLDVPCTRTALWALLERVRGACLATIGTAQGVRRGFSPELAPYCRGCSILHRAATLGCETRNEARVPRPGLLRVLEFDRAWARWLEPALRWLW